jgi:hypothetical protein
MAVKLLTAPVVTVSSAGTAVAIYSTQIPVTSVTIQALFTNVGKIYVGSSTVTSSTGLEIPAGDVITIDAPMTRGHHEEFYLNEIYVNATVSNDAVKVCGVIRSAL